MRKTLGLLFNVPAIVVSVALGLIFNAVEAADPDVVATWTGGIHFLPDTATRSGIIEEIPFEDETPEQWGQRITREVVKPGVKVPAVIYSHGCTGPVAAGTWAVSFNDFGFAFFAPDSFRRPGRVSLCYTSGGDSLGKYIMRQEEIRFALEQIKKLSWIDKDRIVLVGKSEGGAAVSDYGGDGFIAHIIMAYDCRHLGGGPMAPSGVAVLNLVGANDPREQLCSISRDVGGSDSHTISDQAHSFAGAPQAVAYIAKFLKACCGYKPKDATASLDAEAMARKLFEELGGLATMDSTFRAEEALAKGDEKGHAFWLKVYAIALKLSGG